MDWFVLLAVQGVLKSLLQHQSSKASILWYSAFFMIQLSHPYLTTGKTIVLIMWTFVGKVVSPLFNMLSRLVIVFLPRNKSLLISWLWSPSAGILESLFLASESWQSGGHFGPSLLLGLFRHLQDPSVGALLFFGASVT